MTSTLQNKQTNQKDTTVANGDYSEFLSSVASTLEDLNDRITAKWNLTLPATLENIELMSLGISLRLSLATVNMCRGRSISKSMVTSAIKNVTGAIGTDKKSSPSRSATASTSRHTASPSSNSRTGQTKNSRKK